MAFRVAWAFVRIINKCGAMLITPEELWRMQKENSPETSRAGPSRTADESLVDDWLAEKTKLSRMKNLTPLQRRQRAKSLQLLHLSNSKKMQDAMSRRGIDVVVLR